MKKLYSFFFLFVIFSISACKPLYSVSSITSQTISGPSIVIEEQNVNLGDIPVTTNTIVGSIKYSNVGSQELKILKIIGSCICFIESSGDRRLLPGQNGELLIKFDKNRLSAGFQHRSVDVVTNDPNNKTLKINFDFVIQEIPSKYDVILLPPVIDYGRVTEAAFSKVIPVCIVIPYENPNDTAEIQVTPSTNSLQMLQVSDQISENNGKLERTVTFHLSWLKSPLSGIFKEHITFVIQRNGDQENKTEVELLIRGDVVYKPL